MNKLFLLIAMLCLLLIIFIPTLVGAEEGIVTCGKGASDSCELNDLLDMLGKIYDIIVKEIATPLAIIALTIGGIMMMISAGNPNLLGLGKKILYAAIIGLVLVWCSYLIINFILTTLGAKPLG